MTGEKSYVPHIVGSLAGAIAIAATLVMHFEGKRNVQYFDPPGIPTIGYGHTEGVKIGDTATDKQIREWMKQDLTKSAQIFAKYVNVPVPQVSAAAFLDFILNGGSGTFSKSTLLKKLNTGDLKGACEQLDRFVCFHTSPGAGDKAGTCWTADFHMKRLKQLAERRQTEKEICLQGVK